MLQNGHCLTVHHIVKEEPNVKYCTNTVSSVRRILKRGGEAMNFRKFEKNKDQNKKMFHPYLVRFFAQN